MQTQPTKVVSDAVKSWTPTEGRRGRVHVARGTPIACGSNAASINDLKKGVALFVMANVEKVGTKNFGIVNATPKRWRATWSRMVKAAGGAQRLTAALSKLTPAQVRRVIRDTLKTTGV